MGDPTTNLYMETKKNYTRELQGPFQLLNNFNSIEITQFIPGSVIVMFNAVLNQTANPVNTTMFKGQLQTVQQSLIQLPDIDASYTNQTFPAQINNSAKTLAQINTQPCEATNVCPGDTYCRSNSTAIYCVPKCQNYTCPENADCFINSYSQPQCRCKSTNKYVYTGEDCAIAVENLALKANEIIAIAVSLGLVAIILTIIIVLAVVYRRRRQKRSPSTTEESIVGPTLFESREPPFVGAAPLQPALYGHFENLRIPRVSRDPENAKSGMAYHRSIYSPTSQFQSSDSDVPRRPSARADRDARLRDSAFSRGLPLAHNSRSRWSGRSSFWSNEEGFA